MTAQQTYEERLGSFDRELEELQHSFIEAIEQVRQAPETDGSFDERWAVVAQRMKDLRDGIQAEDYDRDQLAILAAPCSIFGISWIEQMSQGIWMCATS